VPRVLMEAVEAEGLARADVFGPLGLEEADVLTEGSRISWTTHVRMLDQVSLLVGGDVERLRRIGMRMPKAPSYAPFRTVARSVLSARALYEIGGRWLVPAAFPNLNLVWKFDRRGRVAMHCELPRSFTPSEAFFRIWEGSAIQLPTLLELPPATLLESHVTGRTCDILLELPRRQSLVARLRRSAGAVMGASAALATLDEQQQRLVENARALQGARDEMRALLDRLPDLVVVHTAGTIVWANQAFMDTLGYSLHEVTGTPILDTVAERSRELVEATMRQAPDAPGTTRLLEVYLRSRTGEDVIIEAAPTQAVVFDGVPARLVVGRDVTERVTMQQKLIVADRLASIGLLAAGVAHEVNNPLAYVLNNIEIAQKELATLGAATEGSRTALGVALEGVDRIRSIVRDLLMLARGGGPMTLVDVRQVAESTLALAACDIHRTARLTLDLRPAPAVRASSTRIGQILLALVSNALEAMRDQPRADNTLVVRLKTADDGHLVLEVSDTGCGIPPAHFSRVFEPFFTTKPAGQGTGLGLSVVQQLVVELGGEVTVSSELGRGTTFRVVLPGVPTADDVISSLPG
jgi:PAS domain S-box-containing protein